MACGCQEGCTCYLNSSDTVDVSGAGSSGSPWVPVVIVDPTGGLTTGVNGVGILIDPASTLPYSFSAAGLLLDCCPAEVADSDTIDFSLAAGAVTGDVIPDPDGGLQNTANGVAVLVDPASTADVSTSPAGLRVDVDTDSVAAALFEPGDYKYRASSTSADPLWLLCDGSSVLVATYPDLFAEIGYTFGGAGANFNLPDFAGRGPIQPGAHADVNALADSDGLADAARTPFHTHTGPSHSHGPGTLAGVTAATSAAAALTPGDGTLQAFGVNDDVAIGEAWLNVTSAALPATPAAPTNNASGDGEGPGSSGDVPLSDHSHGIASVAVTINAGTTAAAGTGTTGSTTTPYLVAGYWFIRA
jgi:microcystin-dependent protein